MVDPQHFLAGSFVNCSQLRQRFSDAGYTEAPVLKRLEVDDFDLIQEGWIPVYQDRLVPAEHPLDLLIALFLLHLTVKTEAAEAFFQELWTPLVKSGFLQVGPSGVQASCDVYPCEGVLIATDHRFKCSVGAERVYYLGKDSYTLARGMVSRKSRHTLDLCAGSGVHGILAAGFSDAVTCVDINPRAIAYIEFNKQLNGVENVKTIHGNLFSALEGQQFDLILSNPPFVPTPFRDPYFDSEASGERILEELIREAGKHLTENGLCQIFTLLIWSPEDVATRIVRWASPQQLDLHILYDLLFRMPVRDYILLHLDKERDHSTYSERVQHWANAMQTAGIQSMADGMISLRKASGPGNLLQLDATLPAINFNAVIERYFPIHPFSFDINSRPIMIDAAIKGLSTVTGRSSDSEWQVEFQPGYLFQSVPVQASEFLILDLLISQSGPISLQKLENDLAKRLESGVLRNSLTRLYRLNLVQVSEE